MAIKDLFTTQNITRIVSFLIVTAVFNVVFGLEVINPTNISWLMSVRHDWGQHYLGWAAYRFEPWSFPLGKIEALCYPGGTNVGFWDSIPLIAIPLKIFSPLLPDDFQYLGVWILFCYYMSTHYTIKIFNLYKLKPIYIITGVILIVCNAVLVFRSMHPSLCSHWLIIASVYYYLKPATAQNVSVINRNQVILVVLSSLIHPYMALMIAGFTIATPFKHYFYDKLISAKKIAVYPAVTILSILVLWILIGLITFGDGAQSGVHDGYGLNSMNLNALWNSSGFSALLPGLESYTFHQYEGFMYLGLGMMGIVICSLLIILVTAILKKHTINYRPLLPLFLLALAYALFGITNKFTFNTTLLFTVPLPGFFIKFGEIFRASARFFWPAFYLIILYFFLILVKSRLPHFVKITLVVAFTALQLYDLKPIYTFRHLEYGAYDSPLDETQWNKVLSGFDRIITYPPANTNLLSDHDYQDLCFLSIKNHKVISNGYAARDNVKANAAFSDSLTRSLNNGVVNDKEIYVTTPQYMDAFKVLLDGNKVTMQSLDGYNIIYSKNNNVAKVDTAAAPDPLSTEGRISTFIRKIGTPGFYNDEIFSSIDTAFLKGNSLTVNGWAFLTGKVAEGTEMHVVLIKDYTFIELPIVRDERPGVTEYFKLKYSVNNCGFSSQYDMSEAKPGKYKVGVYLVDKAAKKEGLMISDKFVTK